MPGLALVRPVALAGGAGQRVMLGLAVQVGDPVLGDLVGKGGVHHDLLVTWLDFRRQLRPAARQPSVIGPTPLLSACRHLAPSPVAPPGSQELLRFVEETARRLFGAAAWSLALLSEGGPELVYATANPKQPADFGAPGIGLEVP